MQQTLQSWRDRAIERSRVLTDGFEVALTWAGGLADWILFICLVCNIVEVLAHLAGTPFSNIVMGTQSVLLDIGGFALLTLAVHAHQRGAKRTRNSAATVGGLLMLVTLATVVLITVGNLWPKAASQVQNINQALILARIGMTIVYEATIHLLRHAEQQERQVHQTQVHQTISALVEQKIGELGEALTETVEQSTAKTGQEVTNNFAQFQDEISLFSVQLLTLISTVEALQKSAAFLPESESESGAESSKTERTESSTEGDETGEPGRRYFLTFEEVSAQTGLSIPQLQRKVKSGLIEVNSSGKIRAKSLQNLQRKPIRKAQPVRRKPALSLVKKEAINQ